MDFLNMTITILQIAGFLAASIVLVFAIMVLVELIAAIVKRGGE